jgi:hypothetical protein
MNHPPDCTNFVHVDVDASTAFTVSTHSSANRPRPSSQPRHTDMAGARRPMCQSKCPDDRERAELVAGLGALLRRAPVAAGAGRGRPRERVTHPADPPRVARGSVAHRDALMPMRGHRRCLMLLGRSSSHSCGWSRCAARTARTGAKTSGIKASSWPGSCQRSSVSSSGAASRTSRPCLISAGDVDPRSAAERCSWTRRSPSPQVTDLRASRSRPNPWTHVRTVFEPTTSRDAYEARTRPERPAITTTVSPTYRSGS